MILPAFGVTIHDFERLRGHRLRPGGHDLRLGAQRLEAGGELRPRRLHRDHPRQALARGDQGHRQPGDEVPRRPLPRRARHGRGAAGAATSSSGAATPRRWRSGSARRRSPGFDFARDLERVGIANQTTMLSGESLAIAEEFAPERWCGATAPRPTAHFRLLRHHLLRHPGAAGRGVAAAGGAARRDGGVGGYNSSNTCHLAALVPVARRPHLPHRGRGRGSIPPPAPSATSPIGPKREVSTADWLGGARIIGITAGASTPTTRSARPSPGSAKRPGMPASRGGVAR